MPFLLALDDVRRSGDRGLESTNRGVVCDVDHGLGAVGGANAKTHEASRSVQSLVREQVDVRTEIKYDRGACFRLYDNESASFTFHEKRPAKSC